MSPEGKGRVACTKRAAGRGNIHPFHSLSETEGIFLHISTDLLCQLNLLLLLPPQVARPALGVGGVHLQDHHSNLVITIGGPLTYKNVNLKSLNDILGDVQDQDGHHQDDCQDADAARGRVALFGLFVFPALGSISTIAYQYTGYRIL